MNALLIVSHFASFDNYTTKCPRNNFQNYTKQSDGSKKKHVFGPIKTPEKKKRFFVPLVRKIALLYPSPKT